MKTSMITLRRTGRRAGFTLLEVLLASAIGVVLLSGLYVAVNVQLRHAQAGRDLVERGTLARGLLARIANDISPTLAPAMPASSSQSSSSSSSSSTTSSTSGSTSSTSGTSSTNTSSGSTGTTGTTGTTGSTSTSGITTTSSTPTTAVASSTGAAVINIGVMGDATMMTLTISRVPRELIGNPDANNVDAPLGVSDLRKVTYWLAGGSSSTPLGLARQEIKAVTSDDANLDAGPDSADEPSYVIAEEVKTLTFRYFDGTDWQESWDSSTPGADGTTAMGPPRAIEVILGVAPPDAGINPAGDQTLKSYRHVIAIPTANGTAQAATTTTTTSGM